LQIGADHERSSRLAFCAGLNARAQKVCAKGAFFHGKRRHPTVPAFAALGLVVWIAAVSAAYGWGEAAHRMANGSAIQSLPPEIRGFFEANRQYVIDHANDPEGWIKKDRYERMRHYIYLDKYGIFPYVTLPHSYKAAIQRYGRGRIGRDGSVPWQIGEYSLKLTNAFKEQKWDDVREDAAALGFYVADAHDPLHTTQNYDGQLTGETGLAERFGIRLIDRYSAFFMLRPAGAAKIDDPTEYAFGIVLEAHTWVDRILFADFTSLEGLGDYSEEYLNRFYTKIGSTALQEINSSAHDTGSYWYTAWLNAGRPPLPAR
jgi:hypothetical protein